MEQRKDDLMEKVEENTCHICGSKMSRIIIDDHERAITYVCACGASLKVFYK